MGRCAVSLRHRRAATKLPPSCRRRCAVALPPPPLTLPPPPRRRQAAADLALSHCRRTTVRWLVVALLSAVRFRHHMPSCDHQRSSCRPLSLINCLPPPATTATATTVVEITVAHWRRKRQQHHHHQHTSCRTIVNTFTSPDNLDLTWRNRRLPSPTRINLSARPSVCTYLQIRCSAKNGTGPTDSVNYSSKS